MRVWLLQLFFFTLTPLGAFAEDRSPAVLPGVHEVKPLELKMRGTRIRSGNRNSNESLRDENEPKQVISEEHEKPAGESSSGSVYNH